MPWGEPEVEGSREGRRQKGDEGKAEVVWLEMVKSTRDWRLTVGAIGRT